MLDRAAKEFYERNQCPVVVCFDNIDRLEQQAWAKDRADDRTIQVVFVDS
jgi:hypothetical protein